MVAWRSVGVNYVRYSQLAAQVTRKCLKGDAAKDAAKKQAATVKITKWEAGKPIKKEPLFFSAPGRSEGMADLMQIAHPHEALYESVYRHLDPAGTGGVGSAAAAQLLQTSGLPGQTLGAIWEQADYAGRGALDRRGVFIALKLVAAVQSGLPPTAQSLAAPLGPPRIAFQGPPSSAASSVGGVSPAGFGGMSGGAWAIGPADQAKYDAIFDSLGPVGGKLPGDKVRPVLLNSGLNPTVLAKIWELSDMDHDGQLDRVEMSVALHLVYKSLQGEAIPRALPDNLIHPSKAALSRRGSISSAGAGLAMRSRAGSVASLNEMSAYTPTHAPAAGMGGPRAYSVQPGPPRPPSLTPQNTGGAFPSGGATDWPVIVSNYADQFIALDTDRDGLVSGMECRPILMTTGMPQNLLAHLWALVDFSQSGFLSLEQYALMVYLVGRRMGHGEELPSVLPPHLVPPSARTPGIVPPAPSSMPVSPAEDDDEAKAILEEIRKLEEEQAKTEEEMKSVELEMRAKQTAMKALQVELKALDGTVAQLEKQKVEANRRLGEMDEQRARLQAAAEASKGKASETQRRIDVILTETEKAAANKDEDSARAAVLQSAVIAAESAANLAEGELRTELNGLESTVAELSRMEREAATLEKQQEKATRINGQIEGVIRDLDAALSNGGSECPALYDDFSRFSLAETPSTSSGPPPVYGGHHAPPPDPFAPSGQQHSPAFAPPPGTGMKTGGPPPRPAPPPSKKTPVPVADDPFANADPFADANAAGGGGSFADFSNFGNF